MFTDRQFGTAAHAALRNARQVAPGFKRVIRPPRAHLACWRSGAGALDVALAMSGEPFPTTMPATIKVRLVGKLSDWVPRGNCWKN